MNDVDARMDRLRRAARYRYQQLVDSEIERGSLDPDEVREERRLLRLQDVERHARARIEEAERRGVFEGNPYHGKPLPGNDGRHDPDWWIKAKIEREDIRGIATPPWRCGPRTPSSTTTSTHSPPRTTSVRCSWTSTPG